MGRAGRKLAVFVVIALEVIVLLLASPKLHIATIGTTPSTSYVIPVNNELLGVFSSGTFSFNTSNGSSSEITLPIAQSGDIPLVADWDGDGVETVGFYRPSERALHVRNRNQIDAPEFIFSIANVSLPEGYAATPVVGDWDGNGLASLGLYLTSAAKTPHSMFMLFEESIFEGQTQSTPTAIYLNGSSANDFPIVGDWDGDGTTTIGVYRPGTGYFYLRNSNETGRAQIKFRPKTDRRPKFYRPLSGDWDASGIEHVGLFDQGTAQFLLYNSFSSGTVPTTRASGYSGQGITGRVRYSDPHNCGNNCVDLVIDSSPQHARVYLDSVLQEGVTPLRITSLVPKRYSVGLEKDNFGYLLLSVDLPAGVSEYTVTPIPKLPNEDSWSCGTPGAPEYEQIMSEAKSNGCAVSPFAHCANDPRVINQLIRISEVGGLAPGVVCEDCHPDAYAYYDCETNIIHHCGSRGPVGACETYAHELGHAAQHWAHPERCNNNDCFEKACREVESSALSEICCSEGNLNTQCVREEAALSVSYDPVCREQLDVYVEAAMASCIPPDACKFCSGPNPSPECLECPVMPSSPAKSSLEELLGAPTRDDGTCEFCPPIDGSECDDFCDCADPINFICGREHTCVPRANACQELPPGQTCSKDCLCPDPLVCDDDFHVCRTPDGNACTDQKQCETTCEAVGLVCDYNNIDVCACRPNNRCPSECAPGTSCDYHSGTCQPVCSNPPCICEPSCGPLLCDQQTGRCKPTCDNPPCECEQPCTNGLTCNKDLGVCQPPVDPCEGNPDPCCGNPDPCCQVHQEGKECGPGCGCPEGPLSLGCNVDGQCAPMICGHGQQAAVCRPQDPGIYSPRTCGYDDPHTPGPDPYCRHSV